jgi:hypothetical protein
MLIICSSLDESEESDLLDEDLEDDDEDGGSCAFL